MATLKGSKVKYIHLNQTTNDRVMNHSKLKEISYGRFVRRKTMDS